MMIDPEYHKEGLKKKTAEQIMAEIRRLKNAIGRLKNAMEHPNYEEMVVKAPRDAVRLSFLRQYLERTKEALAEVGGTYIPSKAELKAKAFDDSIPLITKMELENI